MGVVARDEIDQSISEASDYGKYKIAQAGDIVMNKMQAWNGVFGVAPIQGIVSPDYSVFRCSDTGLTRFLALLFRTDLAAGEFFKKCRGMGTAFLRLNSGDFLNSWIALPKPREEEEILNFLDRETAKIDALIAEQQRLIELLQEKRQAVISHAVTKGLNPNAPMKDSGVEWLGEVPEHWEIKPLKRLAKIENSGCYGEEEGTSDVDLPVATTAQIDPTGRFLVEKMSIRSFTLEEAARYSCHANDILVVKSSGSATNVISGKSGLVDDECEQFVFSNFLLRAKPLDEHSAKYIYYLLRSSLTRSRVEKMCSTTTYPNLQVGVYCSAQLPVPPLAEQRDIAIHLDTCLAGIDDLVQRAQTLIDLFRERRSALISAAVTGQIDVRGLAIEEEP